VTTTPEGRAGSTAAASELALARDGDHGVTLLTLSRPEKRNAMNPRMHEEMTEALEYLRYDTTTRVVVITGAGVSFCAGMDLKEFFIALRDKPAEYDRITRLAVEWRGRTLRLFPKPTIAMINGYCFGGAFSIVEGCDLAITADEATFGLSEVNFGLFPGGSVSKSLANLLRPRDNVLTIARDLATKDPEALRATKDAYRHSLNMDWDAAMSYSFAREQAVTLAQHDAWRKEGIGDFLQGRYRPGLGARPTPTE